MSTLANFGQLWPSLAILGHHYSLVVHRKCSSKFLVLSIGKEMGLKEGGGGGGVAESFMVFVLFGVELFNF